MKDEYMRDRIHLITDASDETKTGGVVWTTNAQKAVEEKGGEIQTNTEVTDIYQDETGTVVGVAAGKKNYKANKGVVFAMASIDHNEEMAFRYDQQQYWDLKTQFVATAETNTGDGIRIGMGPWRRFRLPWRGRPYSANLELHKQPEPRDSVYPHRSAWQPLRSRRYHVCVPLPCNVQCGHGSGWH